MQALSLKASQLAQDNFHILNPNRYQRIPPYKQVYPHHFSKHHHIDVDSMDKHNRYNYEMELQNQDRY